MKTWSGEDLNSALVFNSVNDLLHKYQDLINNPIHREFDTFTSIHSKNDVAVNICRNPIVKSLPSLLLTGLNQQTFGHRYTDFKKDADLLLIPSTSGGKTYFIYQQFANYYGMYFVPTPSLQGLQINHFGPRDFCNVQNNLEEMSDTDTSSNTEKVLRYIMCLVVSRLIILRAMCQSKNGVTPYQWLVLQLKSSQEISLFTDMAKLVKNFCEEDLKNHLEQLKAEIYEYTNQSKFPLAFDEAQLLLTSGINKYASTSMGEKRHLYSAIVKSVFNLNNIDPQLTFTFWGAGTGFSLSIAEKFALSQIAGSGKQVSKITLNSVFNGVDEILEYLTQLIKPDLLHSLPIQDLDSFVGRRRFTSKLAEHLLVHGYNAAGLKRISDEIIGDLSVMSH